MALRGRVTRFSFARLTQRGEDWLRNGFPCACRSVWKLKKSNQVTRNRIFSTKQTFFQLIMNEIRPSFPYFATFQ